MQRTSSHGFNRLSVQRAIRIAQNRLKLLRKSPKNGCVLFCGRVRSPDGCTETEVCELLTPPLPVPTNSYKCDSRFHTEKVIDLFNTHLKYGYVVVTSDNSYITISQGTKLTMMFKTQTDLPNATRRGGQSANRIARIRDEKRHNYIEKIVEQTVLHLQNVEGIIIAGNAELPFEVKDRIVSDTRIIVPVLGTIKISNTDSIGDVIQKSLNLIQSEEIMEEKKYATEIEEYIRTSPDLLVFGEQNIDKCDSEYLLKYIVTEYKLIAKNSPIRQLYHLPLLQPYGGTIGVLYYPGIADHVLTESDC